MQFRVVAGKHHVKQPDGKNKVYRPGDVVDSETDLVERFNSKRPGFPKKFERVGEGDSDVPDPTRRRPDESLADFGARIMEMARQEGAENSVLQATSNQIQQSPTATTEQLQAMTVQELQSLAAAEEVDLKGVKSKDAVLKILISHFAGRK